MVTVAPFLMVPVALLVATAISAAAVVDSTPRKPEFLVTAPPGLPGIENGLQFNVSTRQRNLHLRDPANEAAFRARGGWVSYRGFDSQQRVLGASALINSDTFAYKMLGSQPDGRIEPSGWANLGVTGNNRQRCHLIGKQLGGSGKDARNFFTCHRYANSPVMRHFENKVAKLVRTFPTTGPWRRDKGVKHIVTPRYTATPWGNGVPDWVQVKSELFMSGVFTRVLQDVLLYMGPNGNTAGVQFNCAGNGIFADKVPRSLHPNRVRAAPRPC